MTLSSRRLLQVVQILFLLALPVLAVFFTVGLGSVQRVDAGFQGTPTPTPTGGGQGRMAFVANKGGRDEIYLVNADGSNPLLLTKVPANDGDTGLTWSPDGRRIAFTSDRSGRHLWHIWVMNADGTHAQRLTSSHGDFAPAWSPDGKHIAFLSDREGKYGVYTMDSNGDNQHLLARVSNGMLSLSWSPDSKNIAFDNISYVYILGVDKDNQEPSPGILSPDWQIKGNYPAWSPDGKQIAFVREVSSGGHSRDEIFVINVDLSGERQLTFHDNPTGYFQPSWSPDGQYLAFSAYPLLGSGVDAYVGIYIIGVDGRNLHRIVDNGLRPVWQP